MTVVPMKVLAQPQKPIAREVLKRILMMDSYLRGKLISTRLNLHTPFCLLLKKNEVLCHHRRHKAHVSNGYIVDVLNGKCDLRTEVDTQK